MTAPWTERERELRAALEEREAQIEHLFRHSGRVGSEDYDALEVSAAWSRLRQPIPPLADPPPPDPRDEALRLAETELLRLWTLVPAGCAGVGGVRTIALEDNEVGRLRQIVDAIRVATEESNEH